MQVRINGLSIENLQKAKDDKTITVDIVANHLTEDTDGETILKEAFSEDVVNDFLGTGIIDYWHDSHNTDLSKEERSAAIIGKPIGFRWENDKPIVTAQLTKSHKIVQDMLPHLEAGQPVYAASVGGSKMVLETKDANGGKHRIIPKIRWDHLAIAPAPYVINRGAGMNVKLLRKAQDILCEFDDIYSFQTNISHVSAHEETLFKALMAPSSVSDMQSSPGGVITKQSIEGGKDNSLSFDDGLNLIDTIIGIKNKSIPVSKKEYMDYFDKKNKKDFGLKSYSLIDTYFQKTRSK